MSHGHLLYIVYFARAHKVAHFQVSDGPHYLKDSRSGHSGETPAFGERDF